MGEPIGITFIVTTEPKRVYSASRFHIQGRICGMAKTVRIATAFLAGVLVALAGALIYVKATSVRPPDVRPNMKPLDRPLRSMPPAAGKQIVVDATPNPDGVGVPKAPAPVAHTVAKKHAAIPARHKMRPPAAEAQIAQNSPPAPLPPATHMPATAPVVADPPATPPAKDQFGPGPQYDSGQPPQNAPDAGLPRQPMTVTLDAGTTLAIRLGETLSTNTNYTGDTFRGTLESPIVRDGYIIADRGSRVLGTVVSARKAGRMSGEPELTLALKEINTTDGQRVQVQTNTMTRTGPSSSGMSTAKVAGGAALGAIIGAIAGGGKGAAIGAGAGGAAGTGAVMLGHSRPAVIPTEAQLTFSLTQPVTITEKLN
jgi:hypothetical protein